MRRTYMLVAVVYARSFTNDDIIKYLICSSQPIHLGYTVSADKVSIV